MNVGKKKKTWFLFYVYLKRGLIQIVTYPIWFIQWTKIAVLLFYTLNWAVWYADIYLLRGMRERCQSIDISLYIPRYFPLLSLSLLYRTTVFYVILTLPHVHYRCSTDTKTNLEEPPHNSPRQEQESKIWPEFKGVILCHRYWWTDPTYVSATWTQNNTLFNRFWNFRTALMALISSNQRGLAFSDCGMYTILSHYTCCKHCLVDAKNKIKLVLLIMWRTLITCLKGI